MSLEALSDDLNTPMALAELHELRRRKLVKGDYQAARQLAHQGEWLGADRAAALIDRRDNGAVGEVAASVQPSTIFKTKLSGLIEARAAARKAKDFQESDRIRDELAAMGVVLKDSKDGTTWEIAR